MGIFGDDVIEEYKNSELFQNAPHPFSIADAAYQLVTKTREDQCIVATGESGSGKNQEFIHHFIPIRLKLFASNFIRLNS